MRREIEREKERDWKTGNKTDNLQFQDNQENALIVYQDLFSFYH